MAKIGQIIGGRFKIIKLLNKGGMSIVYLAEDIHISNIWVVKETPKMINGRENTLPVSAALKEAEIIKKLDHPAIVRIIDFFEDDTALYIVEDYVKGISLRDYAEKQRQLTEDEILDFSEQICDVLIYFHSSEDPVIYRDIKPENIIISDSGKIRLVDFGIARTFKHDKNTDTEYLGTEKYAAPEQYEKYGKQTDMRTDIYGLGGTMSFMAGYCRLLSPELKKIIEKCLEENPDDRYESAKELLAKIRKLRTGCAPAKRKNDVSLVRVLLVVAVVVCICFAVSGIMLRNRKEQNVIDKAEKLVGQMKEDEKFTKEEEQELINAIMPEFHEMKEMEGFEELAYNIGKLYYFYYDYGSDNMAGVNASLPWFTLSHDYSNLAQTYLKIGNFYKKINTKIRESEDSGMYSELFENLSELVNDTAPAAESETAGLEIYRIAVTSIESYMRKFKSDGISKDEIVDLYNTVKEAVNNFQTTSEQTDALKKGITDRFTEIEKALKKI